MSLKGDRIVLILLDTLPRHTLGNKDAYSGIRAKGETLIHGIRGEQMEAAK